MRQKVPFGISIYKRVVMNENNDLILTNIRVYYKIAKEAHLAMKHDLSRNIRSNPNGDTGWIVTFDPEQKSFKNSLIAIVFSGIFIEALFHLLITKTKGVETFKEYDFKSYRDKLILLGCVDEKILNHSIEFKKLRKEVVHEKANLDNGQISIAQTEAEAAINFVNEVVSYFKVYV